MSHVEFPKCGKTVLAAVFAGCVGLGLMTTPAMAQPKNTLNLFIWGQYTDPDLVKAFEKKYDAKVVETNYNSLGEMFAKLQAGGDSQYDIIVPSNYYVPRLINAKLVQPLDLSKLPGMTGDLMPQFVNPPYDPGNKYAVPYQWGTTIVAYNKTKFKDLPNSWSVFFDPKVNPNQPFEVMSDPQVMLGGACAYLGKGYTCTSRDDLIAAAKVVAEMKQRKNFQGFMDGTPAMKALARGNFALGMGYNGDLAANKDDDPKSNEDIAWFLPKEGGEIWVDNMMIPAHAPHADMAYKWMAFLMEPENGAKISNFNHYPTPYQTSVKYLDKDLQNPLVLPDAETLKRLHYTPALSGEQQQFVQQLWDSIQSK